MKRLMTQDLQDHLDFLPASTFLPQGGAVTARLTAQWALRVDQALVRPRRAAAADIAQQTAQLPLVALTAKTAGEQLVAPLAETGLVPAGHEYGDYRARVEKFQLRRGGWLWLIHDVAGEAVADEVTITARIQTILRNTGLTAERPPRVANGLAFFHAEWERLEAYTKTLEGKNGVWVVWPWEPQACDDQQYLDLLRTPPAFSGDVRYIGWISTIQGALGARGANSPVEVEDGFSACGLSDGGEAGQWDACVIM